MAIIRVAHELKNRDNMGCDTVFIRTKSIPHDYHQTLVMKFTE